MTGTFTLDKMAATCGVFERKWLAWFADRVQFKLCTKHEYQRPVNVELSLRESWIQHEFLIVFKQCPSCRKEENEPEKTKRKR